MNKLKCLVCKNKLSEKEVLTADGDLCLSCLNNSIP